MAPAKNRQPRSRSSVALSRAVGLMAFMPLASRAPQYARLMLSLVLDDRTPASRKAMLAGAAGYLLVGRDIIPDEIPILGLTPGPVRKTIRRVPQLVGQASTAIEQSGMGPRLRGWINREEPIG